MQNKPFASSSLIASLIIGASVVGAAAVYSGANAPAPVAAPAPISVGLVDLAKLMNGLEELRDRNAQAKAFGEGLQKELEGISAKIKQADDELKNNIIPRENTLQREEKITEKFENTILLDAKKKAYQQRLDLANGDIVRDLYIKIQASVGEFAQQEGFDIILLDDRAIQLPARAPMSDYNNVIESKRLLFARSGLDVTERLITVMNNNYHSSTSRPSSGGAAAVPGAPR